MLSDQISHRAIYNHFYSYRGVKANKTTIKA